VIFLFFLPFSTFIIYITCSLKCINRVFGRGKRLSIIFLLLILLINHGCSFFLLFALAQFDYLIPPMGMDKCSANGQV
jgi:hypothetical protein